MKKKYSPLKRFLIWRIKHINNKQFIMILSVVIGILGGLGAVIIKNGVHLIKELLTSSFALDIPTASYGKDFQEVLTDFNVAILSE